MLPRVLALALALSIGVAACPDDRHRSEEDGSLVVGVQSDDFGSLVGSIHVVVKKDGVVVRDETLATTSGSLPREIGVTGSPGTRVDVSAEALPPAGGVPIIVRSASAKLVSDAKKLLRVYLESRCVYLPGSGGAPAVGVTCNEPLTCIAGTCAAPEVDPAALEDYEPGWASAPPDVCRPARHGAPQVTIGTGQTAYASLVDGQLVQLEKGPQGGHHIWIAARMKNLRQSGSTTSITSRIVGDPKPVPPVSFVFTFEPDEGSFCAIWGLRYQIDAGEPDLREAYRRFLGKPLEVTIEVRDSTSASARDTRTVQIADKLLCPDGTDACNQL